MPKINILDKHTAELIAAGEVVERPASAIKEMVENAIDAGASTVTVEIMNGGISYIRVADNGCGIGREDVKRAFIRHATSKISSGEDLNAIATLGFRGEALASIASVARVDLLTKTADEECGTHYVLEGGDEVLLDDAGCPVGSTLVVRDLFFNTPARMKFLKKNTAEANAVADVLDRLALSHPEVSLRFIRDGKEALLTPGDGKLYSAIYAVYGREFAQSLIPLDYENEGVRVSGFVSKPTVTRASRSMQLFFLNGRYVKTGTGMAALTEAYKNSIMVGRFPACVIQIAFPFNAVDVNVHPAKTEVRFANEKLIFNTVYYGVKSALSAGDTRPELKLPPVEELYKDVRKPFEKSAVYAAPQSKTNSFTHMTAAEFRAGKTAPQQEFSSQNVPYNRAVSLPEAVPEQSESHRKSQPAPTREKTDSSLVSFSAYPAPFAKKVSVDIAVEDAPVPPTTQVPPPEPQRGTAKTAAENPLESVARPVPKLLGEAFHTYVFVEVGKKLLVIDKHAAHERILFDRLSASRGGDSAQMLITPLTLTLRKNEYTALLDNKEMLEQAGILVEDFGAGSVLVRSVPMCLDGENAEELLEEIADRLSSGQKEFSTQKLDWLYHSIACRAAVKAGDRSDTAELLALAGQIMEDDKIRYCPHGRPVAVWLTKAELEKQFGRV